MSSDKNNKNENNKNDNNENENNENEIATCNRCGFSASPEEFEPCLSPYHDLRCPECGTTDIDWANGNYCQRKY